ncbi:MAG: peroxidase [Planctomycetota bacterium]
MHLESIQRHEPSDEAGRFGKAIRAARRAGRAVPEIYHLFAFRPRAAHHLANFMQEVMRGPSSLSAGQRELIAAWTSARNACLF